MFHVLRFTFQERGITLVEIIIAIFIIVMFSAILLANFPGILRQFALSRTAYQLAQDIRKTQDLGLSGVSISDINDEQGKPIEAKGYGVYINLNNDEEYIIYADKNGDEKYTSENSSDYVLETINVSGNNPDLFISGFENVIGEETSINFTPPNPEITIYNLNLSQGNSGAGIIISLKSDTSSKRRVWINTSGLIRVE